jgi:hypothetical protein
MALLNEETISCLADWIAYESKLMVLSAQESASVEKKGELARNEIRTEVLAFLARNTSLADAAIRRLVDQVHVSEAVRRWHIYLTLSLYYSDLASLQASVLHREQSKYFELRADEARDQAFTTGLGIVSDPIPPATEPLILLPAETDMDRLVRGRVRFLNAAGAEGAASAEFPVPMAVAGIVTLRFDEVPEGVESWRLYLAEDSDVFSSLAVNGFAAGFNVVLPPAFETVGPQLRNSGQMPDRYIRYSRNLGR